MRTNGCSIVTGAGRGIGRTIALRMAEDMSVVLVGKTASSIDAVGDEALGKGANVCRVVGDVRDQATAKRAAMFADSDGPPLHLICNAGVSWSGESHTFDLARWQETFDVNVYAAMHFVQACLPAMLREKRGTIVLMSSMAGLRGYTHIAAYAASKHALVGLAKSLAKEYGKHGIVTVAVCPGFVESDMTARSIKSTAARRNIDEAAARTIIECVNPQRRIIPAEEVAEMVAFVCSGKVPALSGSVIELSGGE